MKNTDSNPEIFFQKLNVEFLVHELKDPIAVIETGARTLIEKQATFGSLSPRQEKTMNRIIRNARKAREMLYSLLEVGRSEAGSFACNSFNPVETTFDVLANCLEMQDPLIGEKMHPQQDMVQALGASSFIRHFFVLCTGPFRWSYIKTRSSTVKFSGT